MLILIMGIGVSGLLMSYVVHTDIIQLKAFIMGLFFFDWQELPNDIILLVHLSLVIALMMVFPVSKLIHAPGLFFAPTKYQLDNPREKRLISPWGAEIEAKDGRNS